MASLRSPSCLCVLGLLELGVFNHPLGFSRARAVRCGSHLTLLWPGGGRKSSQLWRFGSTLPGALGAELDLGYPPRFEFGVLNHPPGLSAGLLGEMREYPNGKANGSVRQQLGGVISHMVSDLDGCSCLCRIQCF